MQLRSEQVTRDLSQRQDLYRAFIEEASKRYANAHEDDFSNACRKELRRG